MTTSIMFPRTLWILLLIISLAEPAIIWAQNSTSCALNFTNYPYKPVGECISDSEELRDWGVIPSTRCCRSALNTLAQGLALRALSNHSDSLYLGKSQWDSCRLPVAVAQQDASFIDVCDFSNLYNGNGECTLISLDFIRTEFSVTVYQQLLSNCSQFHSPSFYEGCTTCTSSILGVRDALLKRLNVAGNDDEAHLCVVSVIIAVSAGMAGNASLLDDFYRCLPAMDTQIAGDYIRIKTSLAKAILAVLFAMMGGLLIVLLIKYVNRKKPVEIPEGKDMVKKWSGTYRFSMGEIENAINNGSQRVALGSGSAGRVYKGVLPSGQVVAIKHIYKSSIGDSFTREVEGFMKYKHPNLVSLVGYCREGTERYLVYEYCPYGNLAQHLLRSDSILSWDQRVKILRYCALALRYLHFHPDGPVIHRDIKLTNILLTENMNPKLADFGLARIVEMDETRVFTAVKGTIGYMDPEYMVNGKLTIASDVYSFGVVALQILSGRRVIALDLNARDSLTKIATDVKMGRRPLSDFEDSKLQGNFNADDFRTILELAVLCVAKSSKGRPTMEVVFVELDGVWKNTVTDMANKVITSTSNSMATPPQKSQELIRV